eukprot:7383228-Prymnesium_polylepis.1
MPIPLAWSLYRTYKALANASSTIANTTPHWITSVNIRLTVITRGPRCEDVCRNCSQEGHASHATSVYRGQAEQPSKAAILSWNKCAGAWSSRSHENNTAAASHKVVLMILFSSGSSRSINQGPDRTRAVHISMRATRSLLLSSRYLKLPSTKISNWLRQDNVATSP